MEVGLGVAPDGGVAAAHVPAGQAQAQVDPAQPVAQARGVDYEVIGRSVVFPRPIAQEGRLGFWRWASMWLGIAGTYRKHETVDVAYEFDGRREVETGLRPQPYDSD